jgi:hypothetical protein
MLRFQASGPVEILFGNPLLVVVEAEPHETSERGFRISHGNQ